MMSSFPCLCGIFGIDRDGRLVAITELFDLRIVGHIHRLGGGRKPKAETEPGLLETLKEIVESAIRGDPEAFLLWVSRSQRHLVCALSSSAFVSQKCVK